MARIDLKKLLQEVKEEQAIEKSFRRTTGPLPSQALRIGSDRWGRKKRKIENLEKQVEVEEHNRTIRRALAQSRYYEKNKAKLNHRRVLRARQPKATFKRARRRAELRGQEWNLTYDEWKSVWQEAPQIVDPKRGFLVDAWDLRGGDFKKDTQMVREDTSRPWEVGNVRIHIPPQYTK
jgi:hypothetical protein